jgi:uncharacterized protein YbbK (DUF523 family)
MLDAAMASEAPPRIAVSSCLLGQNVRFDGGYTRDRFLVDAVGRHVEWVAVRPEVEVGLATPREAVRLERRAGDVWLVAPRSDAELTDAMRSWAGKRTEALAVSEFSGHVLKKDSRSCGMLRVRLYEGKAVTRTGRGLCGRLGDRRAGRLPHRPEL